MAKKSPKKSLVYTLYALLLIFAVLLHMLLDGERVGRLLVQIFTEPTGIFLTLGTIFSWIFSMLFSAYGAILIGIVIAIEFIGMPLAMRYKYLTFKPNIVMSAIAAIYAMLVFRIFAEAFL